MSHLLPPTKRTLNSSDNVPLPSGDCQLNGSGSGPRALLKSMRECRKISKLEWSHLHRSIRNATSYNRLGVNDLRNILRAAIGVQLSDEQVYELLNRFDPQMSGTLPYSKVLQELEQTYTGVSGPPTSLTPNKEIKTCVTKKNNETQANLKLIKEAEDGRKV
ncbi:unnamed protein product [Protopolystoma xenopodis]|uniref:EF-hand domain-containing protein n=1 Tax=Protopolystoma xenopodis TaxID=117903 RepID=A0A448WG64_9PLAT|nr:unnamed protein product [Protopolystoma xenopodis]